MGLHGGKYQFDTNSGGGLSTVGQDFAAALYASDEPDRNNVDYSTEEMPKWAVRLSELDVNTLAPDVKPLPPNGVVIITNEEPTWERFYCFILPWESNKEAALSVVEPPVGMLAPRGGQATLSVQTSLLKKNHPSWLVVGTEEAHWVYAIS